MADHASGRRAGGDRARCRGDRGGSDLGLIGLVLGLILGAWALYAFGANWFQGKATSKMSTPTPMMTTSVPPWSTPQTPFTMPTYTVPGANQPKGGFPTPGRPSN